MEALFTDHLLSSQLGGQVSLLLSHLISHYPREAGVSTLLSGERPREAKWRAQGHRATVSPPASLPALSVLSLAALCPAPA